MQNAEILLTAMNYVQNKKIEQIGFNILKSISLANVVWIHLRHIKV